jgi:hypothetical protein
MTYYIDIFLSETGGDCRGFVASSSAVLTDAGLFGDLHGILNRFLRHSFCGERFHSVAIDESAPELQKALRLLSEVGLEPVFQNLLTPEQRGKFFPIRRERPPFPLDGSEWLQVMGMRANRGGVVRSLQGKQLVASCTKEQARRKGHCLELTYCVFAVTKEFKVAFEAAGLVGAEFRPLIYDPPAPNCQRTFWMDATVTAPWSPWIRRIESLDGSDGMAGTELGHTNEPLVGHTGSVGFDDQGYMGPGIAYRRADLVGFDGVDFMREAEWSVERNGVWRSPHIVSQRFRAWAKKFGCRFAMTGVQLID